MPLDEEYPKTFRHTLSRFCRVLEHDVTLFPGQRDELARALSDMADKARDLDDIATRLLEEPHTPQEIGELLIAFELTTEQLRGSSDTIDGKLYEIADRLTGEAPVARGVNRAARTKWRKGEVDMTTKYPPCPGNAPGPFYVIDNMCVSCEAPVLEAPALMDFEGEPGHTYHCRFRRQPETEEELQQAILAVQVCCVRAVRYGGNDPVILGRINDPGSCDVLPGSDFPGLS